MKNTTSALQESAISSSLLTSIISRKSGVFTTFGCAAVLSCISTTQAESEEDLLPDTTIIANRSETELSKVGSAVSILDVSELEKSGIIYLDDALKFVPGVISESIGGQRGSISSLLLRGTSTNQTHIRVDGVRLSGSNIASGGFLGNSSISGLSRIELLRGPQSALYGGDAIGGVLGLYTEKGSGDPSGSLSVETGSFNTFSSALKLQGEIGRLAYSLGVGYEETDNDFPNNDFEQINYTLRLDYKVHDSLDLGFTFRGFDTQYRNESFGTIADNDTESILTTIYAELQVNEKWRSKLTLGSYDEEFENNTVNSPEFFSTDGERYAAYWDNTVQWNDQHTTTAGLVYERSELTNRSLLPDFFAVPFNPFPVFSEADNEQDQYGIYINHSWEATEALTLTGGVRWEDYDTFGDEFTWRGAASYHIKETDTKLRASIGRGFRAPSFSDFFGFGGTSNFDLDAEESIGWDIGIDQAFSEGKYKVEISYFENRIQDDISFDSSFNPINVSGTSTTRGIELGARGSWLDERIQASLNYTWLEESLDDQPEHSLGLRINATVTEKLNAGISVNYLDDRSFGGNDLDSYILVNLHASYKLSSSIALNVRVENLFDETYELANFGESLPGRGTGVFGGLTYEW